MPRRFRPREDIAGGDLYVCRPNRSHVPGEPTSSLKLVWCCPPPHLVLVARVDGYVLAQQDAVLGLLPRERHPNAVRFRGLIDFCARNSGGRPVEAVIVKRHGEIAIRQRMSSAWDTLAYPAASLHAGPHIQRRTGMTGGKKIIFDVSKQIVPPPGMGASRAGQANQPLNDGWNRREPPIIR